MPSRRVFLGWSGAMVAAVVGLLRPSKPNSHKPKPTTTTAAATTTEEVGLSLPTTVTPTTAGHLGHHAEIHKLLNTLAVNVQDPDYGASPASGASANATAIQAAISQAEGSTGPRALYFPGPGTYTSNPVTVTKPIAVLGDGWDTTVKLADGANDYLFRFDPTGGAITGAVFAGLTLDGNAPNQTGASGCVYAKGAVQCLFSHVHFTRPYDAALWLYEISPGNIGHHNRVQACLFDQGSTSASHGQGLRIQANDENYVTDCDFESMGGGGGEPYAIKDWAGINSILGNVFVGGKEAIRMQDISGSRIVSNMFDGPGRAAIHITGSGIVVMANLFSGGSGETAGSYGALELDGSGANSVLGNVFTSPATAGQLRSFIREYSSSVAGNIVEGNRFTVNGSLGTAKVERGGGVNLYRHNAGYVTEASGTDTVASGTTSKAVTHGLDVTPAVKDITVTLTGNPTNNVRHWVSAVSSTTFTVTTSADPGASGLAFAWQAVVL